MTGTATMMPTTANASETISNGANRCTPYRYASPSDVDSPPYAREMTRTRAHHITIRTSDDTTKYTNAPASFDVCWSRDTACAAWRAASESPIDESTRIASVSTLA